MEPQPPVTSSNNKLLIYGTLLIGVVALAFILLQSGVFTGKNSSLLPGAPVSPPVAGGKGSLIVKTQEASTAYKAGQPVTVQVYADSADEEITGYDLVLQFDQKIVKYTANRAQFADFQSFVAQKEGMVTITAVKKINATTPSVFKNSLIHEFTFQAVSPGNTSVTFDYVPGSKKDSNLINTKSEDILGKVTAVPLSVVQ